MGYNLQIINKLTGHEFQKELKFHPVRRWRFDFAHTESKTAIEIEGGAFAAGRHTRGTGFIGDMAKYNSAAELGWCVLRYTPQQMNDSGTYEQIKNVIKQRK